MEDLELALLYKPRIYFDKAEPFEIKGMGFSIFHQSEKSSSFRRVIEINPEKIAFAVEYAVYFDYDIQHLYDLEHIWIYVGHDGKVADAEASFHGRYMKAMALERDIVPDGLHAEFFCQPGKHAFMPEGRLFKLLPDWDLACNALAGRSGLLVMDMFGDKLSTTPALQQKVQKYIKTNFSFEPTLQFEYKDVADALFLPWPQLKAEIPERIQHELALMN